MPGTRAIGTSGALLALLAAAAGGCGGGGAQPTTRPASRPGSRPAAGAVRRPPPAAPRPGETFTDGAGIRLVYVPPGRFVMGSPVDEPGRHDDETLHPVRITRGFWIAATELTRAQWDAVMAPPGAKVEPNDLPVVRVSWRKAEAFCRALSRREGAVYRLPTEAEWEYACRAGSTGPFAGEPEQVAWHMDNSGEQLHPVATKKPNAWGLFDMHGNAAEWCGDFYASYPPGEAVDPTGPAEGRARVVRGGSFGHFLRACRSAARASYNPAYGLRRVGFRVVRALPDAAAR